MHRPGADRPPPEQRPSHEPPFDEPPFEELLTEERRRAAGRHQSASEELRDIVAAADGANTDDEHDPEGATIAFERARVAALLDDAESQLRAVDRAIERLAAGSYGRCVQCGQPIGAERLRARPAVEHCLACAEAGGGSLRPPGAPRPGAR